MKFARLAFVLTALAAISEPIRATAGDSASGQATGRIAGRVQDRATGQYLSSARVSIKGTSLSTFTDRTGTYRFASVPNGPVVLEAFYTGLDSQEAALNVTAEQNLEQNFQLGNHGGVVQLEQVTVRGARALETESNNEQRFAPNLKLVAATANDDFVTTGSLGEFMKSLPGVIAEYSDSDRVSDGEIIALSVRGFSSKFVGLTLDGAPIALANEGSEGPTRSFSTAGLSLNNLSRVEVTLVPTPSMPADSLGGSINLVSKNAFERSTAQFGYRVLVSVNQHALRQIRSPDTTDREINKMLPGFEFDYTLPVSKNFGLVLTGLRSDAFDVSTYRQKIFSGLPGNPYVSRARFEYNGRTTTRNGGSLKADWRVTPNTVLSFGVQGVSYAQPFAKLIWEPTTGTANAFGPEFTNGGRGGGGLGATGGYWKTTNSAISETLRARFDDGTWRIEGGITHSNSRYRYGITDDPYFNQENISAAIPVRVNLTGITTNGPAAIEAYNNNDQPVDLSFVGNYRLGVVYTYPGKVDAAVQGVDASARRQLAFSFPAALQIGAAKFVRTNDHHFQNNEYTFNGGAAGSLAPYLSIMAHRPLSADFPAAVNNFPWISTRKLYAAWQNNPGLFIQTPRELVSSENSRIASSNRIEETVTAAYLQAEAGLFHNRLTLVTGVRWEQTNDVGLGPLSDQGAAFLRNPSGAFVLDGRGGPIRRPEAGSIGSLDELRLTLRERAYRGAHTYDGWYPSLNATWHATENLQLRLGWAKTYGRPDLDVIAPNVVINQQSLNQLDPAATPGFIQVSNPALKPWSADNYDLGLEYYSDQGGLATLGVFRKNISNFFATSVRPATGAELVTLGLDARYLGWYLSTQTNTDRARIDGVTLNLNQSLRALGPLGRYFSVFGNLTRLWLDGEREADFSSFVKSSANWGFQFSAKKFEGAARWNYRSQQKHYPSHSSLFGSDAYDYTAAAILLDVNLAYRVRPQTTCFLGARNLLNEPDRELNYGAVTPGYARQWAIREFGAQFTAGIKGTF